MMPIAKLQILVTIGLHLDESLAKFLNHLKMNDYYIKPEFEHI